MMNIIWFIHRLLEKVTTYQTSFENGIQVKYKKIRVCKSNSIISAQKRGELEYGVKAISIIENDVLLDVGEKYIFFALTQDDGSLLLSGEASNISLSKLSEVKQELAK